MRLRSPLKPIGVKTKRWAAWRRRNYDLLSLRARGRCEGCGQPKPLEPHHVHGRDDEPYSSHVSQLAALCRSCHRGVTGEIGSGIDIPLNVLLIESALARAERAFGTTDVDAIKEMLKPNVGAPR